MVPAPDVEFKSTGRGSGGRRAGMLQGDERGGMRDGARGCYGKGNDRRRNADRLGASKGVALVGGRLREGAAIGVVRTALCLEMREAGAGIAPREMEGGGVGNGEAHCSRQEQREEQGSAKPDGEERHGMECAGSARLGQVGLPAGAHGCAPLTRPPPQPRISPSACGPRPSWGPRPSSCTHSSGTLCRGWWERRRPPGCSSRARRAGRSDAGWPA